MKRHEYRAHPEHYGCSVCGGGLVEAPQHITMLSVRARAEKLAATVKESKGSYPFLLEYAGGSMHFDSLADVDVYLGMLESYPQQE